MFQSINPANGEVIQEFPQQTDSAVRLLLEANRDAQNKWKETPIEERAQVIVRLGTLLLERTEQYGAILTAEMGKIKREAEAEVKKCASLCDYYAEHAASILKDEQVSTPFARSWVRYEPLGSILAIMPWNFPFWQALRFIVPNLMAGNGCVLKHAPNVFGAARAIEELLADAGLPGRLFVNLMIEPEQIAKVIENPIIQGVTLTGSEGAGMAVAAKAGRELKKSVMELGGSDPFIVLEDADLDLCCQTSVLARCFNAGQVCISAKRFFVVESLYDEFLQRHQKIMEELVIGDPSDPATDVGPMARLDLLEELHEQIEASISEGARFVTGGERLNTKGWFYRPTLLADVTAEMTCFKQETFGPVTSLIKVKDAEEAIALANASPYGLGASVWSQDLAKAEEVAKRLEAGMVFINGMTSSNPALPFGGVKRSGYGKECGPDGLTEFMNAKAMVIV